VNDARSRNLQVIVRTQTAPGWAADPACLGGISQPPLVSEHAALQEFYRRMAIELRGRVTAYEVWNEPNTRSEWGDCRPDAPRFTAMMRAAYLGVKAGDPDAVVVTGGLSNTGNGVAGFCNGSQPLGACGDLVFLQEMYFAGGKAGTHWDAIGHHPYGGLCAPASNSEADPCRSQGLWFRRLDDLRNIINDFGVPRGESPNVPVWPTEMGWLTDFDRGCNIGSKNAQKVSLAQQGDYLRGSFEYAAANMSWIGPMILFVIDQNVGQPGGCPGNPNEEEFRWFSVFFENAQRTSAGDKLAALVKQQPSLSSGGNPVYFARKGTTLNDSIAVTNVNGVADRVQATVVIGATNTTTTNTLLSWQGRQVPFSFPVPAGGSGPQTYTGTLTLRGLSNAGTGSPVVIPITVIATDTDPARSNFAVGFRTTQPGW
jgi:hypothetical protein